MTRWEIELTDEDLRACREACNTRCHLYGSHDGSTYTGLNVADGYYIGECGELAMRRWFDEFGIRYRYDAEGATRDDHDFTVWMVTGRELSLDVKTLVPWDGGRRAPNKLMIPHAQFLRYRHDAYVAAALFDNRVIIEGIVSRNKLEGALNLQFLRCPTIVYPYEQLTHLNPAMFATVRAA